MPQPVSCPRLAGTLWGKDSEADHDLLGCQVEVWVALSNLGLLPATDQAGLCVCVCVPGFSRTGLGFLRVPFTPSL